MRSMRATGLAFGLGSVGALATFSAAGQAASISVVAPESASPGESVVARVMADISSLPAGSVIAGFGLDVDVSSGAGSSGGASGGAVASVSTASFGTFQAGIDAGDASPAGLAGVVGGQLANVLGSNPGVATGSVQTLFEFTIEIDAGASGVIELNASPAGPFGSLLVFGDALSGSNGPVEVVFSGGSIVVTSACVADVNADGELNGLDFGAWLAAFNAGLPSADQNADGAVNGIDFGAWLSNFNNGCD